jgi:hypothetical protein
MIQICPVCEQELPEGYPVLEIQPDCQSCRDKIEREGYDKGYAQCVRDNQSMIAISEANTRRKCWEDLEKANIIPNFHSELHYSFPRMKSICSCVVCRLAELKQKWLGDK